MQNKPNFRKNQINVNSVKTKDYKNETLGGYGKNKPNSNPISTQNKPKQSQFQNQSNLKEQPKNPKFPPNYSFISKFSLFSSASLLLCAAVLSATARLCCATVHFVSRYVVICKHQAKIYAI